MKLHQLFVVGATSYPITQEVDPLGSADFFLAMFYVVSHTKSCVYKNVLFLLIALIALIAHNLEVLRFAAKAVSPNLWIGLCNS